MISVSSDGRHGSRFTPPCATGLLAQSRVGRVFPSSAHADHVHVDHVSEHLLSSVHKHTDADEIQFVSATGNSAIRVHEYKRALMGPDGCYTLFLNSPAWLVWLLRLIELTVYRIVLGSKIANKIG